MYILGHGEYVSRIHSCRVLEEEGGVQMAGKLGSTQAQLHSAKHEKPGHEGKQVMLKRER